MTEEDRAEALDAVKEAREELVQARSDVDAVNSAAATLSAGLESFRVDTARRLNPIRQILYAAVGVVVATMFVLVSFVQITARCQDSSGFCSLFVPSAQSDNTDSVVTNIITGTSAANRFLENGGTVDELKECLASEDYYACVSVP